MSDDVKPKRQRASQRDAARWGTPIRTSVKIPVAHALLDEAARCKRSVGHVAAQLLEYWYEDVYLPNKKLRDAQRK